MFGIKLLYPSNKSNFQYYAFPRRKSHAETSLRENVISRGVFRFYTLPEYNDNDLIYATEYIEIWEQIQQQYLNENEFRSVENPINATLQIYSSEFEYDPAHGNAGGVAVDPMCEQDHQICHEQGYSRTAAEYRNVEITSYFFVDEVANKDGFLYMEARSNNNHPGWDSQCCSDHGYGVRMYTGEQSDYIGRVTFYKRTFSGGQKVLPRQAQQPVLVIDSFYQTAFGAKFVIYNPDPDTNERVHLELWLSPVDWQQPSLESSNSWTKVAEVEDYVGKGWTHFGHECGADRDDQPITWGAPFVGLGWRNVSHVKFMYTSFREIDILGSFGDDPIPPPDPDEDPNTPPPEPPPPPVEPPPPIDAEPPQTPTTVSKRLTLRREIINSSTCVCDGLADVGVPPEDGGGGGGTGTLTELFYVPLNTAGFARLATVAGSTANYLRFGQAVTQTYSAWIGKIIARVEITLAKTGSPVGNVYCRIRRGFDDSIACTLNPVATAENITTGGILHVFENLTNTYLMQFNDKVLIEFTGGDSANYIKVFRQHTDPLTGTKVAWQDNSMDPGEYLFDAQLDLCSRIFYITGQIEGAPEMADHDVTVLRHHVYDIMGVN